MTNSRIDHLVFAVADSDATCEFYTRVFPMDVVGFGRRRRALSFGYRETNLHELAREYEPKSDKPTPGSADICLISEISDGDVLVHLQPCQVAVEWRLIARTSANGPINSVCVLGCDANPIELSNY